jgi:hypothetical protein
MAERRFDLALTEKFLVVIRGRVNEQMEKVSSAVVS